MDLNPPSVRCFLIGQKYPQRSAFSVEKEVMREDRSRTGKERRKKSPEIVSPQRRDQSETMTLRGSGRGRQDAPSGLKKGFDFGTVALEF